jgi:urease accessory protein
METLALLRGIKFIDSLFPSGGYAFSSGLEAAAQAGAVTNGPELREYVAELLRHGMAGREAVVVGLAHDSALAGDLAGIIEVDRELDAMKVCRETRLASRQMGRQVIRIANDADHKLRTVMFTKYLKAVETQESPGHLAVALGLVLAILGWSKKEAIAAFLYQAAASMVSAALKLLPIGQREAQGLLDGWLQLIEQITEQAAVEREMHSFAPVQDIYAMRHSRLESRLFRS